MLFQHGLAFSSDSWLLVSDPSKAGTSAWHIVTDMVTNHQMNAQTNQQQNKHSYRAASQQERRQTHTHMHKQRKPTLERTNKRLLFDGVSMVKAGSLDARGYGVQPRPSIEGLSLVTYLYCNDFPQPLPRSSNFMTRIH